MKFKRDRPKPPLRLDITALLDVMFILIIFFMLNTHSSNTHGMKIQLPKAKTGTNLKPLQLEILVNDLDQILIEQKILSLSHLKQYLLNLEKGKAIIIKADQDASYGKALKIFDLLRELKFKNISLGTLPEKL